jgi:hypothetical protein
MLNLKILALRVFERYQAMSMLIQLRLGFTDVTGKRAVFFTPRLTS